MVESRFMESGSGGSSSDDDDEEIDDRLRSKLSSSTVAAPDGDGGSDDVSDPTDAFRELQGSGTSGGSDVGSGDASSRSGGDTGGDTPPPDSTPNEVTDAEQQNIDSAFSETSEDVRDAQQGVETDTSSNTRPDDPTPGVTTEAEQQDINAAVAEVNPRTNRLQQGVEERGAGNDRIAAQAMEFERQVLAENDFVDSPDDVRIVRDGDRLRAEFTALGAEGVGVNRSIQDVRSDVAERTGVDESAIGVERRDRGVYEVSVPRDGRTTQQRAAALEQQVIADNPFVDEPSDVKVVRDGAGGLVAQLTASGREDAGLNPTTGEVAEEFAASTPGVDEEDVVASRTDDGFSVALRPGATIAVGDLPRDAQQDANEGLVGSLFATTRTEPLGPNEDVERATAVLSGLSARTVLRQSEGAARRGEDIPFLGDAAADRRRDLGDTPIENPLTGNRVEDDLNSVRSDIGEEIDAFREFNAALGDYVASQAYGPDAANDTNVEAFGREGLERTVTGYSTAPANLLQAPFDAASASKEVAETAGYLATTQPGLVFNPSTGEVQNLGGAPETAVERSTQATQQTALFGASTAAAARERPIEFVTTAAAETALGGLAASSLRSASRRGRVLGRETADLPSSVSGRGPRVELVRDADAPLLDIDTDAFGFETSGSIRALADEAVARRRQQVRDRATRVRDRASAARDDLALDIRDTTERFRGAFDLESPGFRVEAARRIQAARDAGLRARDRARARADDLATDIGFTIEEAQTRLGGLGGSADFGSLVDTLEAETRRRGQQVTDAGVRGRDRAAARLGDFATDARFTLDEGRARAAAVPGQIQDGFFRARERSAAARSDLFADLRGAEFVARERARAAQERARDSLFRGVERARFRGRDLRADALATPALAAGAFEDALLGGASRFGGIFTADTDIGFRQRQRAARRAARQRLREGRDAAAAQVEDVGDFLTTASLRVGPRPPSQRPTVLDVGDLEGVDVDLGPFASDDLGELGGFDTVEGGEGTSNPGGNADARRVGSGDSGQQAVLRAETELVDPQPRPNARTGVPSLGGGLAPLFASGDTEAATQPTVTTESGNGLVGGLEGDTTGLGVGSLGGVGLTQLGGVSLGLLGSTALGGDLRTETRADSRLDVDTRADLRARREATAEFDRRRRLRLNTVQTPQQTNTPRTPTLNPPSPRPRPDAGDSDGQTGSLLPNGPGSSSSGAGDDSPVFGFLAETVTDAAAGGFETATLSPGEAALEELAAPGATDLPTAQILEGGDDIEAALDLFGGGLGGSGTDSTNNRDDGGLVSLPTL